MMRTLRATSSMFYSLDERHGRAKSANAAGTTVDRQNGMQTSSDSTFIGMNDANFDDTHLLVSLVGTARPPCTLRRVASLPSPRGLCNRRCLSVCLLAALRNNFRTDLHEIFRED